MARKRAVAIDGGGTNGSDPTERYAIRALERGIRVLDVIADSPEPMTLTAVAAGVGLTPSTTLRLLRTLQSLDMVQTNKGDDRYLLGFRILRHSQALLKQL